ncbi:hypothetical protein TDMWS_20420 [Thermodesulfomicrobium sp. WS]|uniref:tetratricopeptide repeat protein n=1 Tax=Thermodesulfomicrobium sp. WS TaxID=3004129 RepID=UPI002493A2B2|nr:HrpB1 family type III secretion system apparatus protein [Thermodesulfomicrobium sp. WS]BDV01957.1 hypothetical protein TDMWS_20420 [Thermodesulfomicrobium sp. WS]
MEFESRLVKVLMEAGIAAGVYGWKDDAEKILQGLLSMRPNAEEPYIGLALIRIMAERHDEAVQMLRDEALPLHPESDLLRAFLALALKLSGKNHESEHIAKKVTATEKNTTAARLVSTILSEM